MLLPLNNTRVWLCTEPTDMRKSFNGLSAAVKHRLGENPLNGHLYVFINRRRTQMKILYFDRSGYAIWAKRLERGRFITHDHGERKQAMNIAQLQCLLEGIELNNTRRYKRFSLPTEQSALV
ncbi:MAG: IS66 family insertion sequence element accessory protein TnpB [Burkholderiaceae bacterium]